MRLVRDEAGRRNWAFDSGAAALQLAFSGDVPLGISTSRTAPSSMRTAGPATRSASIPSTSPRMDERAHAARGGGLRHLARRGCHRFRQRRGALRLSERLSQRRSTRASTSAPISMTFDRRRRDNYPHRALAGALKLSTPSLRRFADWLGSPVGPGSTLGRASLFGTGGVQGLVAVGCRCASSRSTATAPSGALKIVAAARPDITGTLAFETLDLSPYFCRPSTRRSRRPDWRVLRCRPIGSAS